MTDIKSEIKEEPMFSPKNFFKPTSKNVQLWGLATKGVCIGIVGFALSLLATNVTLAVVLSIGALIVGGIAEVVILFTREKPVDTLVQAVTDLAEERANIELTPTQITIQGNVEPISE